MMPEHRHLEPTPKRSIVTDGDARPSSVATVSGLSFRVAGQISERARAAGDDIACVTPVRWLVVVRCRMKCQRHECRGYVVEQRIQTRSPASVVICTRRTVGRPAA